jgi:hypothetical protein
MNFKLILILLIVFIASCKDHRIKELNKIPDEFCGEWIDQFGEFKKVVTQNRVFHFELNETGVIDPIESEIIEIYEVERNSCEDCTDYGIEIAFKTELGNTSFYYLNNYQPRIKKFLELVEVETLINPYDESRESYGEQIWKRDDL